MIGNINIGSSVLKRETAGISKVASKLTSDGWEKTGELGDGRVQYFQKSGINITILSGPAGTLIFPSGPVRGRLLGDDAVGISQVSLIGLGASNSEENPRTKGRRNQIT